MIGDCTPARIAVNGVYCLPGIPAPKVINDVTILLLDLIPLDNGDAGFADEPRDVEHFAEHDVFSIVTDVGWNEHG